LSRSLVDLTPNRLDEIVVRAIKPVGSDDVVGWVLDPKDRHVIAAAPDMLEALKATLSFLMKRDYSQTYGTLLAQDRDLQRVVGQAIARAEGKEG